MNKQKSIHSFALAALGLASALALTGCGSTGSTVSTNNVAYGASAEKQDVQFPDVGAAWLKGGSFVDVEQLRRVGRGMTKNQVRELISYPHFSEGLFGPKEWDYLFNFRTGSGDEFVTCQYKVVYKDGVSNAMYWKEPACANFLQTKPAEVPRAVAPTAPERFKLSADALFAFDKSSQTDILPDGRRQIEALAASLAGKGKRIERLSIIGFTDRLGSDSYNQALSLSRANTVRELLVQYGIERSVIRTAGAGESQPVVTCPGEQKTPALVSCLQPNRRVEIEVYSER